MASLKDGNIARGTHLGGFRHPNDRHYEYDAYIAEEGIVGVIVSALFFRDPPTRASSLEIPPREFRWGFDPRPTLTINSLTAPCTSRYTLCPQNAPPSCDDNFVDC